VEDFEGLRARVPGFVDSPRLADYAEKYAEHVDLQRTDGVLVFRMHHRNGPPLVSFPAKNAWVQAIRDVGADPENEVVIFTGTGDRWIGDVDRASFAKLGESKPEVLYEHHYGDQLKLLETLMYGIDVPTIAAINGPVHHFTFGLMTDLTICSDTTVLTDGHFAMGTAPGDGLGLQLQALMGVKRAAFAAYLAEPLDAARLLELGLVNEVVPPERLLARAHEIAEVIMRAPWTARRATHAIVSRPWKQLLARDQGFHLSQQMYALQLEVQGSSNEQWQKQREFAHAREQE
jgi:enoyl-CoA hydratase/carnithine racemase